MMPLQKMAFFLLFLGALVFIHELGHFLVAKWLNVKVLKFSIGFGPPIFKVTRGETEYQLAWIPLGGYVKMAGELPHDELAPEEAKRGFSAQAPWRRALIVLAGPAFNLIFPVVAYFFVFIGSHQATSTRIGSVEPGLPAAAAKLEPGDRITAVDGRAVRTFEELRSALSETYDRQISFAVERDGKSFMTQITPSKAVETNPIEKVTRGMIGISPMVRPPVVGVPAGSKAEAAGLKTFDRILSVNGAPVKDELELRKALVKDQGPLLLEVARMERIDLAGAAIQKPATVKLTVEKEPGELYAALGGAERGDLYIGSVVPGSPAEAAGLKAGDRLVALNGKELSSFLIFAYALQELDTHPFTLSWRSGAEPKQHELAQVKTELDDEFKVGSEVLDAGLRPWRGLADTVEPETITLRRGPGEALVAAAKVVPEIIRQTALVIGKLFTGQVPFKAMGGPVMMFQIASKSAEQGVESFLIAMAAISVNLGLMNLLPIPVLDGFQLIAALWEQVRRRPIPMRAREVANMVGLALLAVLMVMVLKNDITRVLR